MKKNVNTPSNTKNAAIQLDAMVTLLDQELKTKEIADSSLNGLQVGASGPVQRVALAVDASLDVINAAVDIQADLLIVHHGLFWGQSERLIGPLYVKIKKLVDNNVALYASHLPLDLHPVLGNNIQIARSIGLKRTEPFGEYHGVKIGCGGVLPQTTSLKQLEKKIDQVTRSNSCLYSFGRKNIKKIAIVSGGAGDMAVEAACFGFDAFITGEITHQTYHVIKESKINVIAGGHYATETFGVKAIGRFLEKKVGIKSFFLDFPTGL